MDYSALKIEGHCDVNYLWTKQEGLSTEDIDSVASFGVHSPDWDSKTILLSIFNQDLSATDMNTPIIGYIIQRQKSGSSKRTNITKVKTGVTHIQDFNIENRAKYNYYIIPIYDTQLYGEPIATNDVFVNFDSWSLVGLKPTKTRNEYTVDKNNIWNFYINNESEDFSLNTDITVSNSLGRFPKIHRGDADYITGGLSCLIGNVSCSSEYKDDTIEKLSKWRRFCNNGSIKLLRDPKGHIIPCDITDVPKYSIDYDYNEMPSTISFSYTQVADSDNIVVYIENV